MGYHRAGFEVVGVDIAPQPNYPFEFHEANALTFPLGGFNYIHASPPCQAYSPLNAYNKKSYPDLVGATRDRLLSTGCTYVIENVTQAPLIDPAVFCGAMFGLRVYRHRGFESNLPLHKPKHDLKHVLRCARNGYLPDDDQFMTISGGKHSKAWQRKAAEVMGVPWMETIREVCESIPPAYTELVGFQLLQRNEKDG